MCAILLFSYLFCMCAVYCIQTGFLSIYSIHSFVCVCFILHIDGSTIQNACTAEVQKACRHNVTTANIKTFSYFRNEPTCFIGGKPVKLLFRGEFECSTCPHISLSFFTICLTFIHICKLQLANMMHGIQVRNGSQQQK